MATYNATNAREQFFSLMNYVLETHEVLTVTGKKGNMVMISEEDWESIRETLHLTSIPGMTRSIKSGLKESLESSSDELTW